MSSFARARMRGSSAASFFGANTGSRSLRHFVCSAPFSSSGIATWCPPSPRPAPSPPLVRTSAIAPPPNCRTAWERVSAWMSPILRNAIRPGASSSMPSRSLRSWSSWGWSLMRSVASSAIESSRALRPVTVDSSVMVAPQIRPVHQEFYTVGERRRAGVARQSSSTSAAKVLMTVLRFRPDRPTS